MNNGSGTGMGVSPPCPTKGLQESREFPQRRPGENKYDSFCICHKDDDSNDFADFRVQF